MLRTEAEDVLDGLIGSLPEMIAAHAPACVGHGFLSRVAGLAVRALFGPDGDAARLGPFGTVAMPYVAMGAVDSADLLNLDELILLAFYWRNRGRYVRVADLGANVGWHSLALARAGYQVRAYEPDPRVFGMLTANLAANQCGAVEAVPAAIAREQGEAEFVRVLGNWTSSHLVGSKANPYGPLERFSVPLRPFAEVAAWADLIKIDVEGHEAAILTATDGADWHHTDAMVEVGSAENAAAIHAHFHRLGVGLFAQSLGWRRVETLEQMPCGYRDGSLFISCKPAVPWQP